jgi:peptidoglycan hydrolase CwlO-like protein
MNFIKRNWQIILIVLLILFGMNKCVSSCNRGTTIDKQGIELVQKDSIIKAQADSLNILKIRWNDAQKSQTTYQGIAMGNQQQLLTEIESLQNIMNEQEKQINALKNQNTKLKNENKQLKQQINNK